MTLLYSGNTLRNKLLKLIFSSNVRLYSQQKRRNLAVIVSSKRIYKQLLPAILAGTKKHLATRSEAVIRRADHSSVSGTRDTLRVVEALFDSHFRKQRNLGPTKVEIEKKINSLNKKQKPIALVGLMFTRKNI